MWCINTLLKPLFMKNFLLLFTFLFLSISSIFGQFKFGAGLDTNFDAFGVSGKANYLLNEEWGAQVGFTFFLSDFNPTRIDIDGQYVLTTAGDSDEILLKALGGFNYWKSGVPNQSAELGINIGANISFPISDMNFYIEPRLTLISVGDFFIGAGMYF